MKELLTASRMGTLLGCMRKHFWRYELGLQAVTEAHALRFGSAWHAAMEARWQGAALDVALAAATSDPSTASTGSPQAGSGQAVQFEEVDLATLGGLLAGYYARYASDPIKSVHPEVEFRTPLAGSRTFDVAGKIDGLAVMHDGRLALVEHKTAGCDIGPDADYWLRLRGNAQVMQYVLAARALGWDVSLVIYDVARKPAIRPRQGETAEAFGDRLAADAQSRPDFYFARREVPVLDDDLAEFEIQRSVMARMILACRGEARRARRPEHGWPRNVGEMSCRNCEYQGFCLQNTAVDAAHPPAGFRVGAVHGELEVASVKGPQTEHRGNAGNEAEGMR